MKLISGFKRLLDCKAFKLKVKIYKHKKSGKLYSLTQGKFLGKIVVKGVDPKDEGYNLLDWNPALVLYKAEYPNPDGPYFCRYKSDFERSFKFVKEYPVILWNIIRLYHTIIGKS